MRYLQFPSRLITLTIILSVISLLPVSAGPQHWGFGMSYLATLEQSGGQTRLAVYEGPVRAKNDTWISRWLDHTTDFSDVAPGGLVVGSFWPGNFSKDYLITVGQSGTTVTIKTYEPPEVFKTGQWTLKSTGNITLSSGTVLAAAAGDLLSLNKDQLLLLVQDGSSFKVVMVSPPTNPVLNTWSVIRNIALPSITGAYLGFACGDFWDENKDRIAVATNVGGATNLSYYSFDTATNSFSFITADAASDLPLIVQNGLTAGDYVKDGFDVLTLIPADNNADFQLRVAPAKPGSQYNPGPVYTGKAISGQWLPGNGGTSSKVIMTGTFGNSALNRTAFASGRLFGYINTDLNSQYPYTSSSDAEISFAHRTPLKGQRLPYGWPALGETVTYEINLKNNGQTTIPAGSAVLKVWINTPYRNADTNPATCDSPDVVIPVSSSMPAFNPSSPAYLKYNVTTNWPYGLTPVRPGAEWMKLDLTGIGERWLVVSMDCTGDNNPRNNRYEAALNALTFHPIFRATSSLADRSPTVMGDPCSKEYLSRKLADAVQTMYERSGTTTNQDVLVRVFFDGYETGWPDDLPEPQRSQKWQAIQKDYEGWRELDGWWGIHQGWERFNWGDGGAELHETAHLFQPLGDLYQYYVFPVWTGAAKMADDTPVQLMTYAWGPDSFGTGHAVLGQLLCELAKNTYEGVRNNAVPSWWTLSPDNIFIRVLDRDGNPVQGAQITLYSYNSTAAPITGTTGTDGRWDTGLPSITPTIDQFGCKHYYGDRSNEDLIVTVKIGSYQDCAILGAEDVNAYGHLTTMYQSFVHPTEWTWDFKTNYKPGAVDPAFDLEAAVRGSLVQLGISGMPGATYRLYRRWEPGYIRTFIGEYFSPNAVLTINQDMSAADSHRSGRFRAIYEVTQVNGSSESLPRCVQVTGLNNARGVTLQPDGKLIVAANSGIANPFGILFDGTTPYREYFYHFRFGHTAIKFAPSRITPGKYFATLLSDDMPWNPPYRFDIINPPSGNSVGYDIRNDISGLQAVSYTTTAPYTIRLQSIAAASLIKPNDQVSYDSKTANVISVVGDTITVDAAIFPAGLSSPWFGAVRLAGRIGSRAEMRELKDARGVSTVLYGGKEYIIIADYGNRRVVVWDDTTGYVTHWQSSTAVGGPAAIAPHPFDTGKFFVLERRSDRQSKLYLFSFDGTTLQVQLGYPVSVSVGDYSTWHEMGLSVAADVSSGGIVAAVTDASARKVVEYILTGGTWQVKATYTQASGTYAGASALEGPIDVAYASSRNGLILFAVDGAARMVKLTDRPYIPITAASAKKLADGTLVAVTGATSARFPDLAQFYIQDASDASGIQVRSSSGLPDEDQVVSVIGQMSTDLPSRGERYIQSTDWWDTEEFREVKPVGMNARALGGGPWGLQEGVYQGQGLNNIGLLVRTSGKVTGKAGDLSSFYIDDGSNIDDGGGIKGLRVDTSVIPPDKRPSPYIGDNVVLTGISSMYELGGNYHRQIRLRFEGDYENLSETKWAAITGPVADYTSYNHIGTDGISLYVVFSNQQFYRYTFSQDSPTTGTWERLADPPRTVCANNSFSDLAYQNGYLYTSALASGSAYRTIIRYSISSNTWEIWKSGGDVTSCRTTGNGLFMDPIQVGVGYSAYHNGNYWVKFDWNVKTSSNTWMSTAGLGVTDAGWVSANEDIASNGAGVFYATKNDSVPGLTDGDIIYTWNNLSSPNPSQFIGKPWLSGLGQSIEFIPSTISPSKHNELWLIRGADASSNAAYGYGNPTNNWARLDLDDTGSGWTAGVLPGIVGYSGEITLVGRTVFVRGYGANWYVAQL